MKIVVLDGHGLDSDGTAWDGLRRHGTVEIYDRGTTEEIRSRSKDAHVLITNKAKIDAELIGESPDLKLIAVAATGIDCVDARAAREAGVSVCNVPSYGTDSVAQYTFALLLELCHHVGRHAREVREGEWSRCPDFSFWKTPQRELAGKAMGIVGFGRIGRRVGDLAHAFGMSVLAAPSSGDDPSYQPFERTEVEDLFARADVISLHCPMTTRTAGLVDRDRLALVKPTAFLINTARGGLVVEADLADALNADRLSAAAVDVASAEPIRADNPLLSAKNCLITPHMAWASVEARRRLVEAITANVSNFLEERPTNVMN